MSSFLKRSDWCIVLQLCHHIFVISVQPGCCILRQGRAPCVMEICPGTDWFPTLSDQVCATFERQSGVVAFCHRYTPYCNLC